MYCGKNDLVEFFIMPTIVSSLRDTYLYGFYYTAHNQPMMTFKGIECDADIEIEDILYG